MKSKLNILALLGKANKCDDHQSEDIAKFVYKQDMKVKYFMPSVFLATYWNINHNFFPEIW
jgi:hypothetical protein